MSFHRTVACVGIALSSVLPAYSQPNAQSSESSASPPASAPAQIAPAAGTAAPAPASGQSDEIAELRQQIQALSSKVDDLQQQLNQSRLTPVFNESPLPNKSAPSNGAPAASADLTAATEPPAEYVPPKETNLAIFNPEISAAIDVVGSYSHRADNVNFIVRDAEIMIQANVDQLAHAYAVFNAETELNPRVKTDTFDDITVGLEEAAIETTALPYGFQLKAGQFFADFTRLGKVHSHELPFTDRPLSLDRIIGGEDKARGLELSWVPPIGHYFRVTAGAVDNLGADPSITGDLTPLNRAEDPLFVFQRAGHRAFADILYYGRVATIVEFGPRVNLNVGADYARGRDRGERQIASGDFKLSWTPRPDSYDVFELSGEYLWSQGSGTFSDDALFDGRRTGTSVAQGGYVYAQYRFGKNWQPGVRFDYLHSHGFEQTDLNGDGDPDGIERLRNNVATFSAYVNYHFSEFNRLRLEVSYLKGAQADPVLGGRDDWQAFLQWTVTLGPHKHPFSP